MTVPTRGIQLMPHQAKAVDRLRTCPRLLLAHDTGLGKTLTAIEHVRWLIQSADEAGRRPGLVLWITEANLITQTAAEFAKFAPELRVLTSPDRLYRLQSAKAQAEYRTTYGPDGPDVLIVSYDRLRDGQAKIYNRFRKPELVVCDEAQAIKGGGVQFEQVRDLTKLSPRVLAMTATPMQNDVMELWHLLAILHLSDLPPKGEFGQRYATWSEEYLPDKSKPWIVVKPQPIGMVEANVGELRAYLARYMDRAMVEEAADQMPSWAPDTGPRWIGIGAAQKAAYAASGAGGVGYIGKTQAGRAVGDESALVDECLRLVKPGGEFGDEPKIILCCETLGVLSILCEKLNGAGIGYRAIEGGTAAKDRTEAIREFHEDPEVRILVGSKVLETGLNLQCARVLISLDCSDNPKRERQREGRIRRIGSPHQLVIHVTLLPDTMQARKKWDRITSKESDVERVLAPQLVGI